MENVSDKWFLNPLFDPLWHPCDGEYLVYNKASSDTHCFDSITAILLMCLQRGPAPFSILVKHVADELLFEQDDELAEHVYDTLMQLQREQFVSTDQ